MLAYRKYHRGKAWLLFAGATTHYAVFRALPVDIRPRHEEF